MKKTYQTPRLTVHGTIADLTQQSSRGPFLDKTYCATRVRVPCEVKCS